MLTEPLVSELSVAVPLWGSRVTDSEGVAPKEAEFDYRSWACEMGRAAWLLVALDDGPRQMVIVHPPGYGRAL